MPGGVCAVLDYEIELMAEYVAEMSTRLAVPSHVAPNATATVTFRKFISQVLSSTRLPSTTILLGMNYFSKRLNLDQVRGLRDPNEAIAEGEIWRMVTVALLLGSKFLDDNTFQNRSWSDVSGIPVQQLNKMESQWMEAVDWNLYVNLDHSADYTAWLTSWKDWRNSKKGRQTAPVRERLASLSLIETELPRSPGHRSYSAWHQQQVAEYERYSSIKRNEQQAQPAQQQQQPQQPAYRSREPSWTSYHQPQPVPWAHHSSPMSPADSGYGTPDYPGSAASISGQYNDWFNQQSTNRAIFTHAHARSSQPAGCNALGAGVNNYGPSRAAQSGFSYNPYGQNIWGEHKVADCSCLNCMTAVPKAQAYFAPNQNFGQPVMG